MRINNRQPNLRTFLYTVICLSPLTKLLYNNTQRLRRHFAINMFCAFFILSVNQLIALREQSIFFCVASAYLRQFFFLAAFNFMTIICVDTAVSATALRVSSSRDKDLFFKAGFQKERPINKVYEYQPQV